MRTIACIVLVIANSLASPALAACPGQLKNRPSSRFTLDEGEVYDKKTGLIWMRCSVGTHWEKGKGCLGEPSSLNFEEASRISKSTGNGWRLPSVSELFSLVDDKCGTPAVDVVAFPDIGPSDDMESPYWTSSSAGMGLIYYVDFMTGVLDGHSKGFNLAVRLVKSKP